MEKEFNLSNKIINDEPHEAIYIEDFKEFIKEGDKIFYAEHYGRDNIANEKYLYALERWEKFKLKAGKELI